VEIHQIADDALKRFEGGKEKRNSPPKNGDYHPKYFHFMPELMKTLVA
jgi:hypothetical protein